MSPIELPAPMWRRLAAALYDLLLLAGLWLAALLLAVPLAQLAGQPLSPAITRLLLFAVSFFFYGWFWVHGGQTLGMRAWRLKLRTADAQTIGWVRAARRFGLMLVLGPSVLWCWTDALRRAWHDRLSDTRVVVLPKNN